MSAYCGLQSKELGDIIIFVSSQIIAFITSVVFNCLLVYWCSAQASQTIFKQYIYKRSSMPKTTYKK